MKENAAEFRRELPILFANSIKRELSTDSFEAARGDVNVFIETALKDETGESLKQAGIHYALQKFFESESRGVARLPREHGKTTQVIGRTGWLIGNNPNTRIKIVSSSDDLAMGRVKAVRELMETDTYAGVFPGIEKGREWRDSAITVKRDIITPEPTLEGCGIMSKGTGGRADYIFFDDPDDEEIIESPSVRKKNIRRVQNVWLNLLTPSGRAYEICTPWHKQDISHVLSKNWPVLEMAIKNMNPIWIERWFKQVLIQKKKDIGSIAFARGWEMQPFSDSTKPIKGDWFNYWSLADLPKRFMELAVVADLGIEEGEDNSYTVIGTLGLLKHPGRGYAVFLLNLDRAQIDFPQTLTRLEKAAEKAKSNYKLTPRIGIESVAYQKAVPQMMKRTSRFPIIEIKASKSKFIRASRLGVHIENGRVFLKGKRGDVHPDHEIVYDECSEYPNYTTDDCLDMLGHGVEMLLGLVSSRSTIIASGGKR